MRASVLKIGRGSLAFACAAGAAPYAEQRRRSLQPSLQCETLGPTLSGKTQKVSSPHFDRKPGFLRCYAKPSKTTSLESPTKLKSPAPRPMMPKLDEEPKSHLAVENPDSDDAVETTKSHDAVETSNSTNVAESPQSDDAVGTRQPDDIVETLGSE